MKLLRIEYEKTCLIDKQQLMHVGQKLAPEIERLKTALNRGYESDYASFNLVNDRELLKNIQQCIYEKKKLSISTLIVIGIGGSNLGTLAIQEAILGKIYNNCKSCIKIFYVDTVDSDYVSEILQIAEQELKLGNNILLNVISKSGTTTETIANFEVFLQLLNMHRNNAANYIVVTTDKNSPLWHIAQKYQWTILEIPKYVGGRFSVFSAVGLFPLGFLNIDIEQLRDGARTILQLCTESIIEQNSAAISALIKYISYQKEIRINDLFLFSVNLEGLGKWYRQLIAETIGKEYAKAGQKINVGITPTISIGSTDLHSIGQLYLSGPNDKLTTFVTIDKLQSNIIVPNFPEFNEAVPHIQQKPFETIMNAIVRGTKKAYEEKNRPFYSVQLPEKSPLYLGQCLQFFMCEMLYLACLFDVNFFDQPAVELYKQQTREILAHD